MAHTRQQTQHEGSQYRCCRRPMEHCQRSLREGVKLKTYTNRLVDGLVIGFSVVIGGIRRFNVCVPTPLTFIWTLCKAQSTSSGLQHCNEAPSLSVPYKCSMNRGWWLKSRVESAGLTNQNFFSVSQTLGKLTGILVIGK